MWKVRKMNNITEQRAVELQQRVLNCSREEQLKFFGNVIREHTELRVHKEELKSIKESVKV